MANLDKTLYIVVWQEQDREPDWLHVVAKNLTEERAKRYIRKHLAFVEDNPDPVFEYFWHTTVEEAEGVGEKNNYNIVAVMK